MVAPISSVKELYWGCTLPIHPDTKFPTSHVIAHKDTCRCPRDDKVTIVEAILERGHQLHLSNVVKYMIPVVNDMARLAASRIGITLTQGVESLPYYKEKIAWTRTGTCMEILGRGFTPEEFAELDKLPPGQEICTWII